MGVQDVLTLCHKAPFPVLGGISERGIEPQEWVYVIDSLYGLGLEEWIEDELDVVLL